MTQEALKLALEALEVDAYVYNGEKSWKAITAIKEALAQTELCKYGQEPKSCTSNPMDCQCAIDASLAQTKEPVAHSVIAGVLFDFMGWLTSRKERIVLSSADNASPAADAIRDFANMRGLSLDDAKVLDWNITPPQRTWVGLTDEDMKGMSYGDKVVAAWADRTLRGKNT